MKKNTQVWICSLGILTLTAVIVLIIACDLNNLGYKKGVDTSQYYCKPPTGINATLQSNNRIHLTWSAAPNAGQYEISYRTNLQIIDARTNIGTTTNTSYEYSYSSLNNTPGVEILYFYIKTHPSISGYIASGWSNPVSVNIR